MTSYRGSGIIHNANNMICLFHVTWTDKPVLSGHLWDKEKWSLYNRWPLKKRGSIHMKLSMTGQEKVTFKYRWLLNRGDHHRQVLLYLQTYWLFRRVLISIPWINWYIIKCVSWYFEDHFIANADYVII
jgi:hypothetical protein